MTTTTFTSTIGTRSLAKLARVKEVVDPGQRVEVVDLGLQVEAVGLGLQVEATRRARVHLDQSLAHLDQVPVVQEQNLQAQEQNLQAQEQNLQAQEQNLQAQEQNLQAQEQRQVRLDHQGQAPDQALVLVLLDRVRVRLVQQHLQRCTWLLNQIFTSARSHNTCTMCANCPLMMEL
jgi:multidrug resistance efflux pump